MSTLSDILHVWPQAEAPCRVCGQRQPVLAVGCVVLVAPHPHRGRDCIGGRLTPAEVGRDIS